MGPLSAVWRQQLSLPGLDAGHGEGRQFARSRAEQETLRGMKSSSARACATSDWAGTAMICPVVLRHGNRTTLPGEACRASGDGKRTGLPPPSLFTSDLLLPPLNLQAHPASDSPLNFQRGRDGAEALRALCRRNVNDNSHSEQLR
jgi:hypothetical protein